MWQYKVWKFTETPEANQLLLALAGELSTTSLLYARIKHAWFHFCLDQNWKTPAHPTLNWIILLRQFLTPKHIQSRLKPASPLLPFKTEKYVRIIISCRHLLLARKCTGKHRNKSPTFYHPVGWNRIHVCSISHPWDWKSTLPNRLSAELREKLTATSTAASPRCCKTKEHGESLLGSQPYSTDCVCPEKTILQELELNDILFIHFSGWDLLWATWKGRGRHQSFSRSVIWARYMLLSHPSLFYSHLLTPFPSWSCNKHFFELCSKPICVKKTWFAFVYAPAQVLVPGQGERYSKVPFCWCSFHTYSYIAILLKNYNSELNFRKEK